MMTLETQQLPECGYAPFPLGKIPNEYLITKTSIDGKKSGYPVFDIFKWSLEHILKHQRLPHQSENTERLTKALNLFGNSHLSECTLLDAATHLKHAKNLHRRLVRLFGMSLITIEPNKKKFDKFGAPVNAYFESLDHQKARKLISTFTVVHTVEALDVEIALKKALELKIEIIKYISMMTGAACIGTIEIEVTSIKQSRRICDFDNANARKIILNTDDDGEITFAENTKEYRKLEDCETLSSHLSHEDINGESGQFIIHFHGILKVKKHEDIKELNRIFLTNPNWNRGKRQVLFKSFSELWNGKYKSIEKSLWDISYYITKGGSVKRGKGCYLQYNLKMPKDMPMSYDEFLNFNDRSNDSKRQDLIEEGNILDLPLLSHHEINVHNLVVHGLMNWNKSGTGYVVSVGKW